MLVRKTRKKYHSVENLQDIIFANFTTKVRFMKMYICEITSHENIGHYRIGLG